MDEHIHYRLSAKKLALVRCIAKGMTNREAADELGISPLTVRNMLHEIFGLIGCHRRTALAAMFAEGRIHGRDGD